MRTVEAEELRAGRLEAQIRSACRRSGPRDEMSSAQAGGCRDGSTRRRRCSRSASRFRLGVARACPPSLRPPSPRPGCLRPAAAPARPLRPAAARTSGPATSRSMTTSMLCRICRSSRRSSLSWTIAAVDAGPHEALLQQVVEQVAVFPLLAADQRGQHDETACPPASGQIRSMICSRVWAVIGRPHCGQCPCPTRA